jgi:hypothetical protein
MLRYLRSQTLITTLELPKIPVGELTVHKDLQLFSKKGTIDLGRLLFLHSRAECGDPDTADEIFDFIDCVLHDRQVTSVWPTTVGVVTITTNPERTHTLVNLFAGDKN